MTIAFLYAKRGANTAMKKTSVRYFNGEDFLKRLDEDRKATINRLVPEQSSVHRTATLHACRKPRTFVEHQSGNSYLWNYYKLTSGEDKPMQQVTTEDVLALIKELDYKSPF